MAKIKRIAVAGCGGIGSHLIPILYDFGVVHKQYDFMATAIDIYDDDRIEQNNLLHQNFNLKDLGQPKADVLARKYSVKPIARFMEEKDFKKYDVIFSCVDSMTFRKALYEYGWANPKLHWIDGRVESRRGFVFNSRVPRSVLEQHIDDSKERTGCLRAFEKEQNISHTTPGVVAGIMVQLFLNHLREQPVTREKIIFL
jgi:molybdopterin/thiamine biosynthesis adenylyltransferase